MPAHALQQLLDDAVAQRIVPCAALSIVSSQGHAVRYLAGRHRYEAGPVLQADDLFDLASLTKVVATTAVAMRLVEDGQLQLETPLAQLLPEFVPSAPAQRPWREAVTIRHLLAHCGGLPAGHPFHSRHAQVHEHSTQRALLTAVPLITAPGTSTLYSDLGFMLLAEAILAVGGKNLDDAAHAWVFAPLGMDGACFQPAPSHHPHCVPTELKNAGDPLAAEDAWQGVVHDENARWYGGVAGHAGLFASIADLERFARMLLDNGQPLYQASTFRTFTQPAGLVPGSSRCLGWDSPTDPCSGGRHLSPESFGHTGFTGTSLWIDPPNNRAVILLTNAVHPHRDDKGRGYFPWRNEVHSAAYKHEALLD